MWMTTHLARERQSVFVEEEVLEKCFSSPTDTDGMTGISIRSVCV